MLSAFALILSVVATVAATDAITNDGSLRTVTPITSGGALPRGVIITGTGTSTALMTITSKPNDPTPTIMVPQNSPVLTTPASVSLIGVGSKETTIGLSCDAPTSDSCGDGASMTFGPSTYRLILPLSSPSGVPPTTRDCKRSPKQWICTDSGLMFGSLPLLPLTSTMATDYFQPSPVVITAGATSALNALNTMTHNDARALAPGSFAAALMGLAAMYL